ncbi:hypothetical protein HPT25_04475 [Bacillus sp. BRMEA1]|uniref:hypothetical protein n=1 Tax=Neobacillus endophyticus TaxID=2738405 RepID=UPI00156681AD|nr:hypothetical protein [Neobacillus endophyticus]NRD76746.1 hypothetical protein [Neobacillus endophyticus]
MNVKKGLIAGVGAVMLLGGAYGVHGVYAATSTSSDSSQVTTSAQAGHLGKRLQVVSQYKTQIHQLNQLREDRLELKKQILSKRDQLLDLEIAVKQSGDKEKLKQARAVKQQIKGLREQLKPLLKSQRSEAKTLKQTLKNGGDASEEYQTVISTAQQINDKLNQVSADLDQLISILK